MSFTSERGSEVGRYAEGNAQVAGVGFEPFWRRPPGYEPGELTSLLYPASRVPGRIRTVDRRVATSCLQPDLATGTYLICQSSSLKVVVGFEPTSRLYSKSPALPLRSIKPLRKPERFVRTPPCERRGRDSNPRTRISRLPVFQTGWETRHPVLSRLCSGGGRI